MRLTWITPFALFLGSRADGGTLQRAALVTAAPVSDLQIRQLSCPAGNTACADGDGCCPVGAACTRSNGQGLCDAACDGGPTCTYGPVAACCPAGFQCNPTGTLCLSGGLGSVSVPSPSTPFVTAPSFSFSSYSVPTIAVPTITGVPTLPFPTQTSTRTTPVVASVVTVIGGASPTAAAPNVAAPLDGWVPRIVGGLVGLLLVG